MDTRTTVKQRKNSNIRSSGYCSIPVGFVQEEIQPKLARGNDNNFSYKYIYRHFGIQTNMSGTGLKELYFSKFPSGVIQQCNIQPRLVSAFHREQNTGIPNANAMKTRSNSNNHRKIAPPTREPEVEMRIEGDTINDIINKIRIKTLEAFTEECSSVFLKGIRWLPTSFINTKRKDGTKEFVSLLSSLQDLVKKKGSSWKIIRIQECSPSVVEVLLASEFAIHFEEINIVGMRNDERYQADDILSQVQPTSDSHICSMTRTIDSRRHISFLIISLLKKMTRIKKLVLQGCNLDNTDLNLIMNNLCADPNHPKSLEYLDLRFNKFTPIAIQSVLAIHMKLHLHSLKTLKLRQGLRCVVNSGIRDVILQSLRSNRVVLEFIDVFEWDKSVQYLLDCNRAKRRAILCNNDRFPRSVWPLLLSQVVIIDEVEDKNLIMKNTESEYQSSLFLPQKRNPSTVRRQASAFYHIFRNSGAMLLRQHCHPSTASVGLE